MYGRLICKGNLLIFSSKQRTVANSFVQPAGKQLILRISIDVTHVHKTYPDDGVSHLPDKEMHWRPQVLLGGAVHEILMALFSQLGS